MAVNRNGSASVKRAALSGVCSIHLSRDRNTWRIIKAQKTNWLYKSRFPLLSKNFWDFKRLVWNFDSHKKHWCTLENISAYLLISSWIHRWTLRDIYQPFKHDVQVMFSYLRISTHHIGKRYSIKWVSPRALCYAPDLTNSNRDNLSNVLPYLHCPHFPTSESLFDNMHLTGLFPPRTLYPPQGRWSC